MARDLPPLAREYLAEVRAIELRPLSEVASSLEAARNGDATALHAAVRDHLELAAILAARYAPRSWPLLDAIQEANLVVQELVLDAGVDDPATVLAPRIRERFGEIERRQRWADG